MSTLIDFTEESIAREQASAPVGVRFAGADYRPVRDDARLTGQLQRVFDLMKDGRWRTLGEIAAATNDPEASISAQLRHLKKDRFGAHTVNKDYVGNGLYRYQLLVRVK